MPYSTYYYIKQGVDFEMLRQRKLFISDTASAFSDPQKGVSQLEDQEKKLTMIYRRPQNNGSFDSSGISWEFNPEASKQMKKWQR